MMGNVFCGPMRVVLNFNSTKRACVRRRQGERYKVKFDGEKLMVTKSTDSKTCDKT